MNIIPVDIPDELIQLSTTLFTKIQEFDINLKLEIDSYRPQFYRSIPIENSQHQPPEEELLSPAPHPLQKLSHFEIRVLTGIEAAFDEFELALHPPRYDSNPTSLVQYHDLLKNTSYTRTAIYFEIGRILLNMTIHVSSCKRLAEMQNQVKRCVTTKNHKQQTIAALHIYEYFQSYPSFTVLKDIDSFFAPSTIGRRNEKESNKLKEKIIGY